MIASPLLVLLSTLASPLPALETQRADSGAQEPAESPPAVSPPAETLDAAESKRRVFVLTDGRAVRGSAALRGNTWHIEQPSGTVRLPASLVERVSPERDLLREMKRRRKTVSASKDVKERRALARWTVEQGLRVEALTTIDNLLRADADDAVALELIGGMKLRLALPSRVTFPLEAPEGANREEIAALCRFAGESQQPSTVENLAKHLRRVEARGALRSILIAELHRPEEQRRENAALLMRRTLTQAELLGDVEAPSSEGNGVELRALIGRAARDVAGTVRESSVRTLAYAGHPGVAAPFVSALESTEAPRVAMHCAEALGRLAEIERQDGEGELAQLAQAPLLRALTALSQSGSGGTHAPAGSIFIGRQIAYVSDFDVEIAGGSSIADPTISVQNEGAALTARSLGISGYSTRLHLKVLDQALRRAAGAGPKKASARAWNEWQTERATRIEPGSAPTAPGR